jgi:putative endopeptidase
LPSFDPRLPSPIRRARRVGRAPVLALCVAAGAGLPLLAGVAGVDLPLSPSVQAQGSVTPQAAATTAPRFGTWGVDLTGMDTSVEPGDDFFRYVNGAWADRTTIPADRTTYGVSALLRELSERQVRAIIDDWARGERPGGGL